MREGALFGTMFGLGAGAVLVGVTVSRLVVGQAPDKAVEEAPAGVVETASPSAMVATLAPPAEPPPAVASSVAPPPAKMAMAGQHRPVPRKHRRPSTAEEAAPKTAPVAKNATPPPAEKAAPKTAPVAQDTAPPASIASREAPIAAPPPAEKAAPKTAPVAQDTAPTASIAKREAPTAPPPRAQVADAPIARDAPIAIVRGGIARPASHGPGARIIQVGPQDR